MRECTSLEKTTPSQLHYRYVQVKYNTTHIVTSPLFVVENARNKLCLPLENTIKTIRLNIQPAFIKLQLLTIQLLEAI